MSLRRTIVFTAIFALAGTSFARTDPEPDEIAALRAKAERGNAIAQYNLGLAYAQGQSVPADHTEAFAWLTLASDTGGASRALENITRNMTADEIAQARQRLESARAIVVANATVKRTAISAPTKNPPAAADAPTIAEIAGAGPTDTASPDASSSPSTPDPVSRAAADDPARTSRELADAWRELDSLTAQLKSSQQATETASRAAAEATAARDQLSRELDAARRLTAESADKAAQAATELESTKRQLAAANDTIESQKRALELARNESAPREPAPTSATAIAVQPASGVAVTAPTVAAPEVGRSSAPTASATPEPHPDTLATPPTGAPSSPGVAARPTPTRPAAPAKPVTETNPTAGPRRHVILPGDTLSTISRRYYGTANRWRDIFEANRDVLKDERQLTVGVVLRIP